MYHGLYVHFHCGLSLIAKGNNFIDGSVGMDPTQRMQKHIKLIGIITDNNQVLWNTMLNNTADQCTFCSNLYVSLFNYAGVS